MGTGGKRVRVVTMGCSKNRVDSEHLLKQLSSAGYEVSPEEVPLEDAGVDILIINTCGFILDAKEESVQAILDTGMSFLLRYPRWTAFSGHSPLSLF